MTSLTKPHDDIKRRNILIKYTFNINGLHIRAANSLYIDIFIQIKTLLKERLLLH